MGDGEQELPVVLVLRGPTHNFLFPASLRAHFTLLDPFLHWPESTQSFLSRHDATSIRALCCVGHTPVTSDTLALLQALQVIVSISAGLDHIDLQECRRRGIVVTNTSAVYSEDGADYAVALLINVLKRISAGDRFVRAGFWAKNEFNPPTGSMLRGKRVGIVGLGSMGSEVAKRLVAFGCSIAYTSRKKKLAVSYPFYANVCDLAAKSDILIVCCALTEETHKLINKDVMTALGQQGVIVNIGRGALIDEKELVQFLVRGQLGGAGLDVFEDEPHVPKELLTLSNAVLSPHVAVFTKESFSAAEELVIGNLKAFFSNKPLLSPVQLH